ncbi:ferredoxin [Pseudonocardia sp. Cha107L01]|uniref:ferredoxin n=1 Tax=Pseudonocardia sp. Cha107L01 TaxID=3457576 RepID=UPI00403EE3DC
MTYVIALPCVDLKDRSCVEECPVDCIYEGGRALYIHPDECIDCGACEPVCPVEAIYYEDDLPEQWSVHIADNANFFAVTLPGRDAPLGSPGGAAKLGALPVDTSHVGSVPPQRTGRTT